MNDQTDQLSGDFSRRFLFEEADIRGEFVRLDTAFADILTIHQYPPGVRRLLGEFLAAAVLLSTTLKFEGKLILQARSNGQVPLLMVECTSELAVRGIARGAQEATSEEFALLLPDGQLAITVDPRGGQRYQGIVPLTGDTLAHCLDSYFLQSEQLHTRFWLAAGERCAAGLLLQQLPTQLTPDSDAREAQWQHLCTLAESARPEELLELTAETLLRRLYHQEQVRLFQPAPVCFRCSCSRARTLDALSNLAPSELESILQEQGTVTMDCEFCNQQYRFQREDLQGLTGVDSGQTLH